MQEEVYVEQPPSFKNPHFLNHVYKLQKALFGLQQAPIAWYECLSKFLLENWLKIWDIDRAPFTKTKWHDFITIQICVVDILFGAAENISGEEFSPLMSKEFGVSMIGESNVFLCLQIKRCKEGIQCMSMNY